MADTDRELLTLAAKASGLVLAHYQSQDDKAPLWLDRGYANPVTHSRDWNPIADDGDALQLAAKLGISITPYPIYNSEERHSVIAKQRRKSDTLREANPTEVIELYGDDPAAAWRRAIVRCAAEIGRAA